MSDYTYLDYAASTPLDPQIATLMADAEKMHYANPSSLHGPGRRANLALEDARKQISTVLGAKPREIVFTSGSTEGIRYAIDGILSAFPSAKIAVSQLEHEVMLNAIPDSAAQPIEVRPSGVLTIDDVAATITDETVLVCAQYVNNETGAVQPIGKIAALIRTIRADRLKRGLELPLYVYADAAQAGLQTLTVDGLGVDMMSMGGSKLYGPKSAGFLYMRTGVALSSPKSDAVNEVAPPPGTPHVGGAIGLAAALDRMQLGRSEELARLKGLEQTIIHDTQNIEGVHINGDRRHCYPGIINLTFNGLSGEDLVAHLDAAGFGVATGSACTASSEDPSHVLLSMGSSPADANASLRISIGRQTSTADVQKFGSALGDCVSRLRRMAEVT